MEEESMKRLLVVLLYLTIVAGAFAGGGRDSARAQGPQAPTRDNIKVGFVFVGSIHDGGFTSAHNRGRLAIEAMGIETAYVENVPGNADAEIAIRNLIDQGCNVIYANSFGHMDWVYRVAEDFPQLVFGHCSGYRSRDNMSNFFGRVYQVRYLAGIAAGYKTQSNRVGYVAAHPIPEVIRGINAFTLGVRSVNPNATVEVMWTNTWFDPAVERAAAIELLNRGVDVLAQHQDSTATMIAANERGAFAIGYNSSTPTAAPGAYLTAALFHWEVFYVDDVNSILNGTWRTRSYWEGLDKQMVSLDALTQLNDPRAGPAIERARGEMVAGRLDPFTGPLADQNGTTRVPAGVRMSDADKLSINWFVQGVVGVIP